MNEPLLNLHQKLNPSSLDEETNCSEESWDENKKKPSFIIRYHKWIIFGSCCITTILSVISLITVFYFNKAARNNNVQFSTTNTAKPKNVIMMISDGLGPASVSFARSYYQFINNKPYDYQLPLDTIHVGQSRTRSSSTLVTDSAAGATAFSCNLKTYNGAIGVDPSHLPCGTVLESAKHSRGMLTGLVATSRITHATPASFSAHVENRDDENSIAKQQIGDNPLGRSVDLMFGGGYCYFLPKSKKGSCRSDSRDLLKEAQSKYDWKTVLYNQSREEFDNLPINETVLPIIQLFTSDHMSYEIDRDPRIEPSLSEMSKKALDILYDAVENKETGFFLMIEGSRIDMAAHSNDAAAHVHEILEYQNTVELVKKYVDEHPDTVMISTSDHETGGLSLARQTSKKYPEYLWYPDVLTKVKSSTYNLAKMIKSQKTLTEDYIMSTIFKDHLGIIDGTNAEIIELMKTSTSTKYITQFLADMISIRAQLGWATHGHSGVDVNLYAYGQGSNHLFGSHENIQIGEFITKILDLNLTEISIKLNHENPSFHLTNLTDTDKLKYNEDLEHYHFVPSHLKHIPFFSK